MMHNRGFLLLTLCVYLACFMLLVIASTRILLPGIRGMYAWNRKCQITADMYMVADLLLRDLWQAPVDRQAWYGCDESRLLWNHGDQAIGWFMTSTGIKRIQGSYDQVNAVWHRSSTHSIISPSMKIRFNSTSTETHISTIEISLFHNDLSSTIFWSFYGRC